MQKLKFSIRKVQYGWFVCSFGDAEIWASHCCRHDGPRQLLILLGELFNGEWDGGFAVFETEPGTYILSIRSDGRDVLELWYTKTNLLDWYPAGVGDRAVLSELPRHLKLEERMLGVEDLDLYSFACAVGDAFLAYMPKKMRDKYIGNWMPFPLDELTALRHALGDDSGGLLMDLMDWDPGVSC